VSEDIDLRKVVADVAAAYFGNSHVTPSDIPTVINHIAASLLAVGAPGPQVSGDAAEEQKLTPAQVRKSITRDALISFEDNKPYKTLRRHLAVRGLTPEAYRAKWGLPKDYPIVAPSYSEARASMARSIGLGNRSATKSTGTTPAKRPKPRSPEVAPAPLVAATTPTTRQTASSDSAAGANPANRRPRSAKGAPAAAVKAAEIPKRGRGRPRKSKELA